jgi:hypothetical protein
MPRHYDYFDEEAPQVQQRQTLFESVGLTPSGRGGALNIGDFNAPYRFTGFERSGAGEAARGGRTFYSSKGRSPEQLKEAALRVQAAERAAGRIPSEGGEGVGTGREFSPRAERGHDRAMDEGMGAADRAAGREIDMLGPVKGVAELGLKTGLTTAGLSGMLGSGSPATLGVQYGLQSMLNPVTMAVMMNQLAGREAQRQEISEAVGSLGPETTALGRQQAAGVTAEMTGAPTATGRARDAFGNMMGFSADDPEATGFKGLAGRMLGFSPEDQYSDEERAEVAGKVAAATDLQSNVGLSRAIAAPGQRARAVSLQRREIEHLRDDPFGGPQVGPSMAPTAGEMAFGRRSGRADQDPFGHGTVGAPSEDQAIANMRARQTTMSIVDRMSDPFGRRGRKDRDSGRGGGGFGGAQSGQGGMDTGETGGTRGGR